MRGVALSTIRRALAVFVLVLAAVLAAWVVLFRVWYPRAGDAPISYSRAVPRAECSTVGGCYGVRPEWALPAAVALAVAGILAAVVLHRPRPISS